MVRRLRSIGMLWLALAAVQGVRGQDPAPPPALPPSVMYHKNKGLPTSTPAAVLPRTAPPSVVVIQPAEKPRVAEKPAEKAGIVEKPGAVAARPCYSHGVVLLSPAAADVPVRTVAAVSPAALANASSAALSQALQARAQRVCGEDAQVVRVQLLTEPRLLVEIRPAPGNDPQLLVHRILAMPELAPYEPKIRVRIP